MNLIPEIGSKGGLLVTDTVAVADKNYCAIYCVEDTIFTSITGTFTVQGTITDATVLAGVLLLGNFTGFQLQSGAVIAYNAEVPQS